LAFAAISSWQATGDRFKAYSVNNLNQEWNDVLE
jgi:hypothetical protein